MQSITYQLPHISLAAQHQGQSQHQHPILALHGWLDNAASFSPLSKHLVNEHVIALDFAGHGLSMHRGADAFYHQMDFVYDLHCLIEQEGWETVTLLGHSMGGIIASAYAAAFPEKVSKLITIEAFGLYTGMQEEAAKHLRQGIESRLKTLHSQGSHPKNVEQAVKARALAGQFSESVAQVLVDRNLVCENGEYSWRTDRRLRNQSLSRFSDQQAEALLDKLACPVLAILGEQGYEHVRNSVQSRKHLVNDLSISMIKGGHHLHLEYPELVADQILKFLKQ